MIKKILIILFVMLAGILLVSKPSISPRHVPKTQSVTLIIADKTYTTDFIASQSALALLQSVNIPVTVKKYSFGTLVESINNLQNTKDKAWIYFINGNSASVGADSYILKPGDKIEWKYLKPQF
jgi:hypothetical protein